MNARIMSFEDVQEDWGGVVGDVKSGGTVLVQEANNSIAAIIPFEDYLALRQELEDLHDARIGDAAYEAYLRDPSGARPLDELMAEWDAKDAESEKAQR